MSTDQLQKVIKKRARHFASREAYLKHELTDHGAPALEAQSSRPRF